MAKFTHITGAVLVSALIGFSVVGIVAKAGPDDIELEIIGTAKVTLADAIAKAENEIEGGRVIEAELDESDDMYFYKLELMRGDDLVVVYMNPASGVIVGTREPGLMIGLFDDGDKRRATQLAAAKVSLSEALAIAEKEMGGKAVEIKIERDDGRYIYEVTTIQPGLEHEFEIDMASGRILDIDEDD